LYLEDNGILSFPGCEENKTMGVSQFLMISRWSSKYKNLLPWRWKAFSLTLASNWTRHRNQTR